MQGAVLVAIAAAIGNLLQGWDNATIAGSVLYLKREFKLENEPTIEGLIVAMSLIGATIITTFSGAVSDAIGRRPMLIASSILYFFSGLLMLWSQNVYMLLFARLVDGFAIGLVVTLVPVYISETAPSEIRGLLNTLPQFTGSGGMFLSYCMVFGMSLDPEPNWRVMLGVLSIPSLIYIALTIFFLPESPRWLVSKGRMHEAKQVLQRLRGREDVAGEMALLVEGLGFKGETSIEGYIIGPADDFSDEIEPTADKDKIVLYGPEGNSWVARPAGQASVFASVVSLASRQGSVVNQSGIHFGDPLVQLFESVHDNLPAQTSMQSALISNLGSMISLADHNQKTEQDDDEHPTGYYFNGTKGDIEANLQSPLLPHGTNGEDNGTSNNDNLNQAGGDTAVSSMGVGGGWQLAWKWYNREAPDGTTEGEFKRIYLHQEGVPEGSKPSVSSIAGGGIPDGGEYIQAAALVSEPALYLKEIMEQNSVGPAMLHPSEIASKKTGWEDLFEPAVKHALLVGVCIQILQQFSGISGVLYYTPQILEQAGVSVLLANMGLSSDSTSILLSTLTTLLMLPCIAVAMRLMDVSGRRSLLLTTLPVLIVSLVLFIIANVVNMGDLSHAILSTISVVVYFCCFVMGFGPIPNIICSEIFPTRVRGICIAICSLTFWFSNIIVTYSLPVLLNSIGLGGVFSIFAVVCVIAVVFVAMKIPETKGMPLEVIIEFFKVGTKKTD